MKMGSEGLGQDVTGQIFTSEQKEQMISAFSAAEGSATKIDAKFAAIVQKAKEVGVTLNEAAFTNVEDGYGSVLDPEVRKKLESPTNPYYEFAGSDNKLLVGAYDDYNKSLAKKTKAEALDNAQMQNKAFLNAAVQKGSIKNVAAMAKETVFTGVHTTAVKVQASAYKGLAAAKAWAAKVNLGGIAKGMIVFALLSEAISLAIKGLSALWKMVPTRNHLKQWAEESATKLQETTEALKSLQTELETTRERIAELEGKGNLTLVEQSELDRLRLVNAELERKIALQNASQQEAADKAAKDAYNVLKSYGGETGSRGENYSMNGSLSKQIDQKVKEYKDLQSEMGSGKTEGELAALQAKADKVKASIIDLAQKGQEQTENIDTSLVTDQTILSMYDDVTNATDNALLALGSISLQDVFDRIAAKGSFEGIEDKLNNYVADIENASDVTKESLTKALGVDFINACEDAGLSVGELISHIQALKANSNIDIEVKPNYTDAVSDMSEFEDSVSTVISALQELRDDGMISQDSISSLAETFGSTTGFEDFIKVATDVHSTLPEVQAASEKLIGTYLDEQAALGNLTEANKESYIYMLKAMGVANAAEIVNNKLNQSELSLAATTNATDAELLQMIGSFYGISSSSAQAATYLAQYRLKAMLVTENGLAEMLSMDIQQFKNIALAAGVSAAAVTAFASAQKAVNSNAGNGSAYRYYQETANKILGQINSDLTASVPIDLTVPSGTNDGSKGSSSKTSAYDKAKKELDRKLEMNLISYNTYYKKLLALGRKYLKGKKGMLDEYREHLTALADARKDAFDFYQGKQETKLDNGDISIDTYNKNVTSLMKKWLKGRKSNAEDLADAQIALLDKTYNYWKDKISDIEQYIDDRNLFKDWVPGDNEISQWEKYQDQIGNALAKGQLDWHNYYELNIEIERKLVQLEQERADKLKEIYNNQKDSLDELVQLTSDMLKQENEDLIDALNEQLDKYKEIVQAKKDALDLTRKENEYQESLDEKLKELVELQAKAAVLKFDTSREGKAKYTSLMEEINAKNKDVLSFQNDQAYDATTNALDEAEKKFEEKTQDKIDNIQESMENNGEWLKRVYSYIDSTKANTLLQKLYDYNNEYGTGIRDDVTDIWNNYQNVRGQYLDKSISDILTELRRLTFEQDELDINNANNTGVEDDSPSDNYKTVGSIITQMKANSAAATVAASKGDTAEQSRLEKSNYELATLIENKATTSDYKNLDYINGVWKTNSGVNLYDKVSSKGRLVASIINDMKNATLSQQKVLAEELRTIPAYANAFYDSVKKKWYKNTAAKKAGTAIFHTGLAKGFVGSDYRPTSQQKEVYSLLTNDELVLNKDNQLKLLKQLQISSAVTSAFKNSLSNLEKSQMNSTSSNGNISISLDIPISISGNANDSTVEQLRSAGRDIANMTIDQLQTALIKRGYATNKSNSLKQ